MQPTNLPGPPSAEKVRYHHLFLILRRVSAYLVYSEMTELLCLNKYISAHLPNNEFLGNFVVKYLSTLFQTPDSQETAISFFQQYSVITVNSLVGIVTICKGTKNLIKNPCRALGFNHWENMMAAMAG